MISKIFTMFLFLSLINVCNLNAATEPIKTGQTVSYGPGDDGAIQAGRAWPNPRFTDNGDCTVTDNLTNLVWLKIGGYTQSRTWSDANSFVSQLRSGYYCGGSSFLRDGSVAGQWRMPSVEEMLTLADARLHSPVFPESVFFNVWWFGKYWTSTRNLNVLGIGSAFQMNPDNGSWGFQRIDWPYYVWPVRNKIN